MDRALAFEAKRWGFESSRVRQHLWLSGRALRTPYNALCYNRSMRTYTIKNCGKKHAACKICKPQQLFGVYTHRDKCECRCCGKPLQKRLQSNTSSYGLKKILFLTGDLEEVCEKCGLGPEWEDELLVLQIDHIDGDAKNNRIENLRILCPNCHTQTDTWGNKRTKGLLTQLEE